MTTASTATTKKRESSAKASSKAHAASSQPCGEPLDQSIEYAVLAAKLAPRADVQYGNFSSKVEAPDWVDIEKSCTQLLKTSIDISVLIWLTRARVQQTGASGLAQGLGLLLQQLSDHPQHIHPQLEIEGELDPAVRANALAALADPDGLLGDASSITISSNTVTGLSMAEVTKAYAIPRQASSKTPDHIQAQLADLMRSGAKQDRANIAALQEAQAHASAIEAWSQHNLGDDAPDISKLHKLLRPFGNIGAHPQAQAQGGTEPQLSPTDVTPSAVPPTDVTPSAVPPTDVPPSADDAHPWGETNNEGLPPSAVPPSADATQPNAHSASKGSDPHWLAKQPPSPPMTREQARALIDQARQWFEHNEPSSPVGVLLKQAHKQVGMRFAQLAASIPPDLLAQWDMD